MLGPGSRFGSYELVSQLGAGGMGVVYQARDLKLGRDVALKVLPDRFAGEPERLARFEREAQLLASLNHPNIAAIYGIEESGSSKALILELVPGDTLADRIARGPIPVDEALAIALQIAQALQAAHEQGIVHRDLKPANIKTTPGGVVKVLDFGLAKLDAPVASADIALSPTMSINATHAGVILGTAAYMAPEQARGKNVDKRADVWAFGVILYEMIVGQRLFAGDSLTDIIAAVIERDVDLTAAPERVRPLLRACLQRDPRKRLQDIGDARLLLDVPSTAATTATPASSRAARIAWVAAAAAVIALAVLAVVHLRESPPTQAVTRFHLDPSPALVSGVDFYMAMSPDGRRLAFTAGDSSGARHIWIRSMDTLEARMLSGTEEARSLFWSPDSRFVAFGQGNRLKKVEATGTAPSITICEINAIVGIGSWNADGVIIFGGRGPGQGGLRRVSAAGGNATPLTELRKDQLNHTYPVFMPDGKHFVYQSLSNNVEVRGLYTGSIDLPPAQQPQPRLLATQYGTALIRSTDGGRDHLLFQQEQTLMAQEFDSSTMTFKGEAVPVAEHLGAAGSSGYFAASATTLTYRVGGGAGRQLRWYDRNGKALDTVGATGASFNEFSLSPDGSRVAVFQSDAQMDVWVTDLTRNATLRLTFGGESERFPVWSPDGRQIAYAGGPGIYRKAADGTGEPELLLKSDTAAPLDWSSDGRFLLFRTNDAANSADLWVLPLQGDRKPVSILASPFDETSARFSPDDRWIVYRSVQTGSSEIYVRPFAAPGSNDGRTGQWMVSTGGGYQPRWNRNGKEILYLRPDNQLMSVEVSISGAALQAGVPKPLFNMPIYNGATNANTAANWDLSRDGTRFLVNASTADPNDSPIAVIENWQQLLKR